MRKTAFERYAPFIQEYIYRKNWADLREVQVEACEAILDTDQHVIIASGTASGKTEAAFFPILTQLEERSSASIGVVYIGPLKALINDQFTRLQELLRNQDIPVWPWHGDISQSMKQKAIRQNRGILQITPESLESLMIRHPEYIRRLFSDLRFIVIDEIHALMGEDRGLQVLCLIARVEQMAGCRPRRIGLSATLHDYQPAMDFLTAGSDRGAAAVGIHSQKRNLSLCVESFSVPKEEEEAERILQEYHAFLYDHCHRKKCLVFTNSRGKAESLISQMKQIAAERKEPDIFYVHHGSVSAALRQETEHALRDRLGPTVAAATLTLELGIDIGDLDSTIQVGAPYTCASFVQRLGRSGRRSGRSQMMFVSLYESEAEDSLDMLPWELLRSIAVIQLYLEEKWVEPVEQKKKPYSLLVHQTLSILLTHGELSPPELAKKVLRLPPFWNKITQEEYRKLLQFMLQQGYLERMENGGIIVGMRAERMVSHYSFYAVFPEEETYRVCSGGSEIGTLNQCPKVGNVFTLAGRAWRTVSIEEDKKIVYVSRDNGTGTMSWFGTAGDTHQRVVQRMKQVLQEDTEYPYLRPNARQLLAEARMFAREHGILNQSMVPIGTKYFYLLPWTGSKELRTLERLLTGGLREAFAIQSVSNEGYYLQVKSGMDCKSLRSRLQEWGKQLEADEKFDSDRNRDLNDPGIVLGEEKVPEIDKYDSMVPEELLRVAFLENQMDVNGAMEILKQMD